MNHPKRRASDQFVCEFMRILLEGDIRFAGVVLGLAMIAWANIAMFVKMSDIVWFAGDFIFSNVWFWYLNHLLCGVGWVWCSVKGLPHPQSMLLGSWCALMWSMIQWARPAASYTSGMTLNLVIIVMGILLIYRSAKHAR